METAVAFLGLILAIVAIGVSVVAVRRSDRNASASTLVALYEGLRGAWERYLDEGDDGRRAFQFAELINLIELACAVVVDGAVHGAARELLEEYLAEVLLILVEDAEACERIAALRGQPNTFKYLRRFMMTAASKRRLSPLIAAVVNATPEK